MSLRASVGRELSGVYADRGLIRYIDHLVMVYHSTGPAKG